MVTPSERKPSEKSQNDPGVSNDPKSSAGDFTTHIWTSINQVFERLGEINNKVGQLAEDQGKLKESVERHDRLITRAIFTVGGAIAVIIALWFIYDHFLKDHVAFK